MHSRSLTSFSENLSLPISLMIYLRNLYLTGNYILSLIVIVLSARLSEKHDITQIEQQTGIPACCLKPVSDRPVRLLSDHMSAVSRQSAVSGGAISVVRCFGGKIIENMKKHIPATIIPGMMD